MIEGNLAISSYPDQHGPVTQYTAQTIELLFSATMLKLQSCPF